MLLPINLFKLRYFEHSMRMNNSLEKQITDRQTELFIKTQVSIQTNKYLQMQYSHPSIFSNIMLWLFKYAFRTLPNNKILVSVQILSGSGRLLLRPKFGHSRRSHPYYAGTRGMEKAWKANDNLVRRCERNYCHDDGTVGHCYTRSPLLAQLRHARHQRSAMTLYTR